MPDDTDQVKAATYSRYGTPDVIDVKDITAPAPNSKRPVIVKVHAASLNPLDLHYLSGTPYLLRFGGGLRKPNRQVTGVDFAGTVVHVEPEVDGFVVGDEVFGVSERACAELIAVAESNIVKKHDDYSFAEAAACGVAGLTAFQGLLDKGKLEAGQRVLINGASGGVGTFAVQIAHSLGAEVTGVCSAKNAELVASLGADLVVDYTTSDFLDTDLRYDIVIDNMGNRSPSACRQIMSPHGRYVLIGGPKGHKALGPLARMARTVVSFAFRSQTAVPFIASVTAENLRALQDHLETSAIRPVIERTYSLIDVAAALEHLAEGHARGKVVIEVGS